MNVDVSGISEYLAAGMLLGAVALVALSRVESLLRNYVANSWLLALLMAVSALGLGESHLVVAAALTALTKGILLPLFLRRIIADLKVTREVEPLISTPLSLIGAFLLVVLVYSSLSRAVVVQGIAAMTLRVAISTTLISLFVMISRRKAVTQVIGLLFMENGLFLAGFSLTRGMPIIIELGVLFDMLMGAIILGVFATQIRKMFASVDLDRLRTLRG